MNFKIGEKVVCVNAPHNWYQTGDKHVILSEPFQVWDSEKEEHYTAYNVEHFREYKDVWIDGADFVSLEEKVTPNYAAAFNMWMSDFMQNPQAYEDSHDSAVRHLKEKLNGEEPSYGAVCAEVLVNYLNKLEQLALESK